MKQGHPLAGLEQLVVLPMVLVLIGAAPCGVPRWERVSVWLAVGQSVADRHGHGRQILFWTIRPSGLGRRDDARRETHDPQLEI